MRRLMIFFFVIGSMLQIASAKQVTHGRAQRQIEAWIMRSHRVAQGLPLAIIQPVQTLQDDKKTMDLVFYANLDPEGFVIITPDDELFPILAFSETGKFDPREDPDNTLLYLLRMDMTERIDVLKRGLISASYRKTAQDEWNKNDERAGTRLQRSGTGMQLQWQVEVGPLLSSVWGQDSDINGNYVFDYYTPEHYVAGCVATAASQILYYHSWPNSGTWTHSYVWNSQTLSADFGAATYDWANMVDDYDNPPNQPEIKRQAAGLISYHTGVAVDMDYSSSGSGANTAWMKHALKNHFRHHSEYVLGTDANFFTRLYNNMLAGLPAELSIRDNSIPTVGHAVVVDGVRHEATGPHYYHLNMGWWGYQNAWYDISAPFTAAGYVWSTLSGVVLDIVPMPDMTDPGATLYSADFNVDWERAPNFAATAYELQQAQIGTTPGTFADGAESGLGNWSVDGNWSISSSKKRSGTYSFHGQEAPTQATLNPFNTLELARGIELTSSSTIVYYWFAYAFDYCSARLEISTDEKHWETLRQHTSTNHNWNGGWTAVIISSPELTSYVEKPAILRWTVQHQSTYYYTGSGPGFYVDDFSITNVKSGTWSTLASNISAPPYSVNVPSSGNYLFRVRPQYNSTWWDYSDVEVVSVELPATVTLQGKLFLEGAYQSGASMHTQLRNNSLVPLTSPYAEAPATAASIPSTTTDWVLLQLYEADGTTLAQSRSAFLRNDGQLINEDGTAPLTITNVIKSKPYYLAIKHRNHIRVMSATTVSYASGSASYDFSTGSDKYYGTGGAVQLETGVWGLWAGDGNQDGSVTLADFDAWKTSAQSGAQGYQSYDMNLNGQVTSADQVLWFNNERAGAVTGMP